MLRRSWYLTVATTTARDLVEAARLGARIAARYRRAAGLDDEFIRRELLGRYEAEFAAAGFDPWCSETLMAAVVRGIDEALTL